MALIDQSPFEWLSFDENGGLVDPAALGCIEVALMASGASDLVVISHGWKTDQVGAGQLYTPLWKNVTDALVAHGGPSPAKIVVAGVLWPSKEFAEDFDAAAAVKESGGTLSLAPATDGDGDLDPAVLQHLLNEYRELVGQAAGDAVIAAAAKVTSGYDANSAAALLRALKTSVGLSTASFDAELAADAAGFSGNPVDILGDLEPLVNLRVVPAIGGTLDLGDAVSNAIQGVKAAVGRLLNQFTYFTMKQRAGTVGGKLGAEVLSTMTLPGPTRLHLIGHSFGARLVTAAAASFKPPAQLTLRSLTLLQGAFSHNGLSSGFGTTGPGAYASVLTSHQVGGPISMTHTHRDSACTIAYPLASRLSRDMTQSLGDAHDLFGAMGANGAQHLPSDAYAADQAMTKGQAKYTLVEGKVNRVLADACVSEHMDVTNADVGALVASALRS